MSDVVLVTGASVGVGLQLARMLQDSDRRLVLTARPSSLARFADVGIVPSERLWVRPLDVTSRDAGDTLVTEIEAKWGGVDVLVNNAGVAWRSVAEHVADQERLEQMDVNFRSPMALTVRCLPYMRARRRGRVIAVSSVGGMMAMPTMAVYSASKYALEGAYEALWYEVRPFGIKVTLVEPGFINSDGVDKVRFTDMARASLQDPNDPYHQHYRHMESFVGRLMRTYGQSPSHVARRILRAIERRSPPLRMAGTFDARVFQLARRLLPRQVFHSLLYRGLPSIATWGQVAPRSVAQGEQSSQNEPSKVE